MPNLTVYLPAALYRALAASDVRASWVCQQALTRELQHPTKAGRWPQQPTPAIGEQVARKAER